MPIVNKVLQCVPLHNSRALSYYANSLILHINKKILNTHKQDCKDCNPNIKKTSDILSYCELIHIHMVS
jgi:hypothetical protein